MWAMRPLVDGTGFCLSCQPALLQFIFEIIMFHSGIIGEKLHYPWCKNHTNQSQNKHNLPKTFFSSVYCTALSTANDVIKSASQHFIMNCFIFLSFFIRLISFTMFHGILVFPSLKLWSMQSCILFIYLLQFSNTCLLQIQVCNVMLHLVTDWLGSWHLTKTFYKIPME